MRLVLILVTGSTLVAFAQQAHIGVMRLPPPSGVTVQPRTADQAKSSSIEGEVRNAVTGEPIRSATLLLRRVTVTPDSGDSPSKFSASSDEHGRFILKDISPGAYRL